MATHALEDFSLNVEAGEFVALMGPSGSGKTTFLNVAGLLDVFEGGVYELDDKDVSRLSDREMSHIRNQKIGFIFQSFNLLSRTSALENVELTLFYSAWTAYGENRAADLLKLVGLSGRELNHPTQL